MFPFRELTPYRPVMSRPLKLVIPQFANDSSKGGKRCESAVRALARNGSFFMRTPGDKEADKNYGADLAGGCPPM